MKPNQTKQQIKVLNALVELNDFKGNRGLLHDLDILFLGLMQSTISEEMAGTQREGITLLFFKLKETLQKTEGLQQVEGDFTADIDCINFLVQNNLMVDFMEFKHKIFAAKNN